MALYREFTVPGDELTLLAAMDACGCVMTEDGGFYCDMDNEKLAMPSRLSARVRGTCTQENAGWKLRIHLMPAPRTGLLALIFAVLLVAASLMGAQEGNSWTGAVLFAILLAAVVINFVTQYESCLRKFETAFRMGNMQ